jgi:hypothetical protein
VWGIAEVTHAGVGGAERLPVGEGVVWLVAGGAANIGIARQPGVEEEIFAQQNLGIFICLGRLSKGGMGGFRRPYNFNRNQFIRRRAGHTSPRQA